jgi:hypothetical protein
MASVSWPKTYIYFENKIQCAFVSQEQITLLIHRFVYFQYKSVKKSKYSERMVKVYHGY